MLLHRRSLISTTKYLTSLGEIELTVLIQANNKRSHPQHIREEYNMIGPRPSQADHSIWRQPYCIRGGSVVQLCTTFHPSICKSLDRWISCSRGGAQVDLSCPCEFAHVQMARRLSLKTLTHVTHPTVAWKAPIARRTTACSLTRRHASQCLLCPNRQQLMNACLVVS